MSKKGGYSPNDMRSMALNPNSSHHQATAENHREQTSGHSKNDMRSNVKNPNNEAHHKDQENTEQQKNENK